MKRVLFALLAVAILSVTGFAGIPENPVLKTSTVTKTKTFAATDMFAASKFLASYKGAKLPPQQVITEYGVDYFPPGGGICMADRTTTWYYVPMHGWFIASQTYSNIYCYYP